MRVYFVFSEHHSDILREEGCKILVSYPYMSDKYKDEANIPDGFSEVMCDSGAYQLQTGTAEVYIKSYALWLNLLLPKHPEVVGYMNLDILGDPVATLENQFYLESEGLHPIPAWHSGEEMSFLDLYCEHYEWVAIGGLVSGMVRGQNLVKLSNLITQRYPNTKFHFFGIGISGVKAYLQVRPYSCDFSTWSTTARFGNVIVPDKKQIIREAPLPQKDRDRLRIDAEYQRKLVRFSVKNILMFEKTLSELENTDRQLLLG